MIVLLLGEAIICFDGALSFVFVGLLLLSLDCFSCFQNMELVIIIYRREVVFYNNFDIIFGIFLGYFLSRLDCFSRFQSMDLVIIIYRREVVFYNNVKIIFGICWGSFY